MTSNASRGFLWILSVVLVLISTAGHLAAQRATATILGTVTDSSGAVIPDATVRATETATDAIQTATSDAQGRYRLSDLPVGDYAVQSEAMGFQTLVKKNITLSIGADVVVDFALPVGQLTQTVTVEGDVSQVETTSAQISNVRATGTDARAAAEWPKF